MAICRDVAKRSLMPEDIKLNQFV